MKQTKNQKNIKNKKNEKCESNIKYKINGTSVVIILKLIASLDF